MRTEDNSVRFQTPAGTGGPAAKGSFCKYSPAKSSENGQEAEIKTTSRPLLLCCFFRKAVLQQSLIQAAGLAGGQDCPRALPRRPARSGGSCFQRACSFSLLRKAKHPLQRAVTLPESAGAYPHLWNKNSRHRKDGIFLRRSIEWKHAVHNGSIQNCYIWTV